MTRHPLTKFALVAALLLTPLASHATTPTPLEVKQYNGAAYGSFPVKYPSTPTGQANAFKLFGEYTLGDVDGDLAFMEAHNLNKVKTYAHAFWSPVGDYTVGIEQLIERNNIINTDPTLAAAKTALADINNPFETWSGIPAGTKWIIPQAAAQDIYVYATANVTSGTIGSSPANMPHSVDIKYRDNDTVKTVTINPNTGAAGGTPYTTAHWDIELAIACIANDRLKFEQPASNAGSYTITKLSGRNYEYVKALIIGNEVLTTGGLTVAQVKEMVVFAKARRTAYGLTVAELPITTSTNSLGSWQTMQAEVLPEIETYIFFNTYGLPFVSVSATDQAGTAGLSKTNPGQSVGTNVITNIKAFKTWLATTAHPGLTVVVGEHGYPSSTAAPDPDNLYTSTHAAEYYLGKEKYKGILNEIANLGVLCFFFEMFDEPWKDTVFPTTGTENNWGVSTASQPERRIELTQYDASSYEVWTFPETRAMKAGFGNNLLILSDSDGDGIADNIEDAIINANAGDSITSYAHVTPTDDFDGDGLTNLEEQANGTDATNSDSDGDFFTDKEELDFGSDPNSADSLALTQSLLAALEYRFTSKAGLYYQVQYTEDFSEWFDIGDVITGDGSDKTLFISFEGRSKNEEKYRIVISDVPPGP